ncbi:MAG: biopolymer transporter ExbD [Alphaproteobacteria bacterium]|nr:biopolymer transporter ExbD [Alphaproteobacteria bacterium]
MGSKLGSDDDVIADINITPFVDIILVVLIIFMVTATTIVKQSIKITLPDAASGEETKSTSLGLTLMASGDLLLDGEKVSVPALKNRLREAKKSGEEVVCLIAAEKSVAHGRVVWLIDLIKSEGIAKFAININKVDAIGPDPATVGEGQAGG